MSNISLKQLLSQTWSGGVEQIVSEKNNLSGLYSTGPVFTKNPMGALEKVLNSLTQEELNILNVQYSAGENAIGFSWDGTEMVASVYQVRTTFTDVKEETTTNTTTYNLGTYTDVRVTEFFGDVYVDINTYDKIHKEIDVHVNRYENDTVFGFLVGQVGQAGVAGNTAGKYQDNYGDANLNDSVAFVVQELKKIASEIRGLNQARDSRQTNFDGDNAPQFVATNIVPSLVKFFSDRGMDASTELGTNVKSANIEIIRQFEALAGDTKRIYFYKINGIPLGQLLVQSADGMETTFIETIGPDNSPEQIIQKCI